MRVVCQVHFHQLGVIEASTQALTDVEPLAGMAGDGKEDALFAQVYETLQRALQPTSCNRTNPLQFLHAQQACCLCRSAARILHELHIHALSHAPGMLEESHICMASCYADKK